MFCGAILWIFLGFMESYSMEVYFRVLMFLLNNRNTLILYLYI